MIKPLQILLIVVVSILVLALTTLLFDLKFIQDHVSRKLIVWLLLLLEFVFFTSLVFTSTKGKT